uniref:Uncharacterized protein n=1 Tax=Opuntia streptacantha TaxID=393608 RepID=A0A7C9DG64_OPUST
MRAGVVGGRAGGGRLWLAAALVRDVAGAGDAVGARNRAPEEEGGWGVADAGKERWPGAWPGMETTLATATAGAVRWSPAGLGEREEGGDRGGREKQGNGWMSF